MLTTFAFERRAAVAWEHQNGYLKQWNARDAIKPWADILDECVWRAKEMWGLRTAMDQWFKDHPDGPGEQIKHVDFGQFKLRCAP